MRAFLFSSVSPAARLCGERTSFWSGCNVSQNEKNEKISVRLRRYFPFSERDAVFTLFILGCAAALCVLLRMVDDSNVYVSMIFLLAVVLVSRCTEGYLYGLVASFAGVVCVNYIFT